MTRTITNKKEYTYTSDNGHTATVIEYQYEGAETESLIEKYPTVNYIGNKEKIADWIGSLVPADANSLLDVFAGGASISYIAKLKGLQVYTNDILAINYHIGKALIENNQTTLSKEDLDIIFSGEPFEGFMTQNFSEVYYFKEECMELDLYRQNIEKLDSDYKKSLALILMRRAMVRKMPYSRFTIKWDKVKQLRDEDFSYEKYGRRRAYHNQSFRFHFEDNLKEYNEAVFNNGKSNKALNMDVFDALNTVKADVIYMDPPYAGTMNDYYGFYSLLDDYITGEKSVPFENNFIDKKTIISLFDKLFSNLQNFKYWMLSYNSRSNPNKEQLISIISKYANVVEIHEMPYAYKVTGKEKKKRDIEYLFIAHN